MAFPSPPWDLHGQLWVSLFYATAPIEVSRGGSGEDGRGVYAAAYLDLESGSTVPHRALVVARRVSDDDGTAYRVIESWADSAVALDGYASLFGYPGRGSALDLEVGGLGPVGRAEWSAPAVAGAHFADTAGIALRTPLRVSTRQPSADGPTTTATITGSARSVPCLAAWTVPEDGPLGWLTRKQPFASFRLRDARLLLG